MRWRCCTTAAGPTYTTCRATRTSGTTATAAPPPAAAPAVETRAAAAAVAAAEAVEDAVSPLLFSPSIQASVEAKCRLEWSN